MSLDGTENPIELPNLLKDACLNFYSVLSDSKDSINTLSNGQISIDLICELYKHIFIH